MTTDYEELKDENHAITAAVTWAVSDDSVDWPEVARIGHSFAESLTILNTHRRRAVRTALLQEQGRTVTVNNHADDGEGISGATAAEMAIGELSQILRLVAGKLSPAAHGFIRYLSEHPEGAAALRTWFRHVGFSNAEITWLFDDLKALDHEFFKMLESADDLDTLLDHAYRGDDMARIGFLDVEGCEVPAGLALMISRFSTKGVTPGLFHLVPVAGAMVYLADERESVEVSHPAYESTLFAMIGARGTCYSSRSCSGSIYARNVTAKTCKRKGGKSLRSGASCIKV